MKSIVRWERKREGEKQRKKKREGQRRRGERERKRGDLKKRRVCRTTSPFLGSMLDD